jgi:MinD superfamily P-loop ATPase
MKELVVLSGKGGTGKTSLTASFLTLAVDQGLDPVICDADVDAANLHLTLKPRIHSENDFIGGYEARILPADCTECGQCIELCQFGAITDRFEIDPVACEGCGVCFDLCPADAIEFKEAVCGQWFQSETRFGPFFHARLGIAQENSGKLVALVREEARKLAQQSGRSFLLTDGPPGIGCPVIASISQANAVLVVAEPTVSGLHDLKRVVELCRHFNVLSMVCVNKFDLNSDMARTIEAYATDNKIHFTGRIEFDPLFTHAMIENKNIFEHSPESNAAAQVRQVWQNTWETLSVRRTGLGERLF